MLWLTIYDTFIIDSFNLCAEFIEKESSIVLSARHQRRDSL